jgi:hypothetical protein
MESPKTHRRSIGLIVVFVTVLTLIAIWNDPDIVTGRASAGS